MDAGPSYIKHLNSQSDAVKLAYIATCKGTPAFVAAQQNGSVYSTLS